MKRFLCAAAALWSLAASAQNLPVAPVHDVRETFFGTTVDDPYRRFENIKDPVVAKWMKAHSDHAHAVLKRITGRDALLARIEALEAATPARVTSVVRVPGDLVFFEKRGVEDNQFKLYVRQGGRPERLLVDPEVFEKKTGKPHAINYFQPSPDGRHLAYGVSAAGSEDATLHVIDVATGRPVGRPVTRAQFGGVSWSPDGKWLVFTRLQALKKGMPGVERYQRSRVVKLMLGKAAPEDKPVFGLGTPGVDVAPAHIPFVSISDDGRWAFGLVTNGTQNEIRLYAMPFADFAGGGGRWQSLVDFTDDVTAFAVHQDSLYLLSHKNASRYQVLKGDMKDFALAKARAVVPVSEEVVTGLATAADAVYLRVRDGNVSRLRRLGYEDGATPQPIALPIEGSVDFYPADTRLEGLWLEAQGWTRARQILAVARNGSVSNTGLQPAGPFDAPDDIVTTEVKVPSHDGAPVPLSIMHKRGLKMDGTHPTLLYGYASYGITEEPWFTPHRLAWLEKGGVFAVANPRGSSVYGEDWYRAGFQASKPNTWKDFIACAEYLVAKGYAKPATLGILGGSAGGILVGRAMTERPDLFGAVVSAVGALDMIRAETTPNGVPNIPEFGTVKTEAGFKALLEMSTYHHIRAATPYPAVLFLHGVNDPRVEVWESTKSAARLMAATTSGKPVLLRLDYSAGHGIGNTKRQQFEERADMYAFLFWQLGQPEFALK